MKCDRHIVIGLLLMVVLAVACVKTTRITTSDAYFVIKSKGNNTVTYRYRPDSTLSSIRYNHGLGIMDSVIAMNEQNQVTYRGVRERETTDSAFLYDSSGVLYISRHYPGRQENHYEQPIRQTTYWPNGKIKESLFIDKVDSLETPIDDIGYTVEYIFSGRMLTYYESGALSGKGPFIYGKPSGVWTYYLENGTVSKLDTLQ